MSDLAQILASIPTGHMLFVELKGGADTATHSGTLAALQRDLSDLSSTPKAIVLISFYPAPPCEKICAGFDGVDRSSTAAITSDAINQIHSADLASCVWTVNSIDDARRLGNAGICSLTTDNPSTMLAALKN